MAILTRTTGRRRTALVATTCAALCAVSAFGVAQALGSAPPAPQKVAAHPTMTTHATSPTGQALPATTATNAVCGQVLTASLTLNGDLYCSGNGLTITGTSVVLNLNGHNLFGPGYTSTALGIQVLGKSATVENGQVAGFDLGVADSGTSDTLTKLHVSQNFIGIDEYGTTNKLTSNEAFQNRGWGIDSSGTSATLTGNRASNNSLDAYWGNIGIYGSKSVVTGNFANGAVDDGVGLYDNGFGNTLTNNVANYNQLDGIESYDLAITDGGGNTAKGNDIVAGTNPEQCQNIICN